MSIFSRRWRVALLSLLFLGCASAGKPGDSGQDVILSNGILLPEEKFVVKTKDPYILGIGDLLEVKFFYNPEFNQTVKIRPDGKVSLTLLDDVEAAGLTPLEFDKFLTSKYAEALAHPDVTVVVKEMGVHRIYVGGEVHSPMVIEYTGEMTVLQAIFQAGGYKSTAKLRDVLVLRSSGNSRGGVRAFKVDLKAAVKKKGGDSYLTPYDIVYVPNTMIAKVDLFVEQYINQIIPRSINFPFIYEIHRDNVSID